MRIPLWKEGARSNDTILPERRREEDVRTLSIRVPEDGINVAMEQERTYVANK